MNLKHNTVTFYALAAAFVASALYQAYRATRMEIPEYDAFTLMVGAFYLICVGVSALVLTDRRWAWLVVSVLVLALLSIGVFWYYPVVVPARIEAGAMGLIGWIEGSVYMGLLFVAGFVCALRLLGAGKRDQPCLLLLSVQFPVILSVRSTAVESCLRALAEVLFAHSGHSRLACLHRFRDRIVHPAWSLRALVGLQQNTGMCELVGRGGTCRNQALELFSFGFGQDNGIFLVHNG